MNVLMGMLRSIMCNPDHLSEVVELAENQDARRHAQPDVRPELPSRPVIVGRRSEGTRRKVYLHLQRVHGDVGRRSRDDRSHPGHFHHRTCFKHLAPKPRSS